MKTRTKKTLHVGSFDLTIPTFKTNIAHDSVGHIYVCWIRIIRYSDEKRAEMECYLLKKVGARYSPAIEDVGYSTTAKWLCLWANQQEGLQPSGGNGILRFSFNLTKKKFTKQAIEILCQFGEFLGLDKEDKTWFAGIKIFEETEVWHKGAWRKYASCLLSEMGLIQF